MFYVCVTLPDKRWTLTFYAPWFDEFTTNTWYSEVALLVVFYFLCQQVDDAIYTSFTYKYMNTQMYMQRGTVGPAYMSVCVCICIYLMYIFCKSWNWFFYFLLKCLIITMDQLFLQIECTKFQNKKYNHVQMSNVFMQIPSHQMRFHLMNGCEREPVLEPVPPNMH